MGSQIMNTVSSTLECPVCFHLPQNPVGLECGHTFCLNCVWNWFHRGDNGALHAVGCRVAANEVIDFDNLTCPSCRADVHTPPIPTYALKELSTIMRVHETGHTLAEVEEADAKALLDDATWGGFFPDNNNDGAYPGQAVDNVLELDPEEPVHHEHLQHPRLCLWHAKAPRFPEHANVPAAVQHYLHNAQHGIFEAAPAPDAGIVHIFQTFADNNVSYEFRMSSADHV